MLGDVAATATGLALVALVARDVFGALFARGARWSLSRDVAELVWQLSGVLRRRRGGPSALAGPLALVLVVGTWAALLVCGFALVYLPHVPDGFTMAAHLRDDSAVFSSLYFSAVTLATLGYGEMTPRTDWTQVVAPVQALVGFGLLTASISWFLSIFPVLARRRALAYDLMLIDEARRSTAPARPPLAAELDQLHRRVVEVERDLVAFPITLYFAELDPRHSLAAALPGLLHALDELDLDVLDDAERLHAAMLRAALDDVTRTLGGFPGYGHARAADVLREYATRHAPRDP